MLEYISLDYTPRLSSSVYNTFYIDDKGALYNKTETIATPEPLISVSTCYTHTLVLSVTGNGNFEHIPCTAAVKKIATGNFYSYALLEDGAVVNTNNGMTLLRGVRDIISREGFIIYLMCNGEIGYKHYHLFDLTKPVLPPFLVCTNF